VRTFSFEAADASTLLGSDLRRVDFDADARGLVIAETVLVMCDSPRW